MNDGETKEILAEEKSFNYEIGEQCKLLGFF
jgi:hypothetical protein